MQIAKHSKPLNLLYEIFRYFLDLYLIDTIQAHEQSSATYYIFPFVVSVFVKRKIYSPAKLNMNLSYAKQITMSNQNQNQISPFVRLKTIFDILVILS